MKDADDPIPVGMISTRDARDIVYRTITPDWQILEERLNPSSSAHHGLTEQDAKCSREEAWRNYDKAQRRALKWLWDRISQGALVALVRDPKTGDILQLDRNKWNSISDFEMEITVVMGARQPVFLNAKTSTMSPETSRRLTVTRPRAHLPHQKPDRGCRNSSAISAISFGPGATRDRSKSAIRRSCSNLKNRREGRRIEGQSGEH